MTQNNSKNQAANCRGLKVKTNVKASTGNSGGGDSGSGGTGGTRKVLV